MSFKPMKCEDFDKSNVTFSKMYTSKAGGKTLYLNYDGQGIFIQTPEMEVPFDSGDFEPSSNNPTSGKYKVRVSLKGHDSDPKMKAFYEMMTTLDEMIKEEAVKNGLQWFKKKNFSMDAAENAYNEMVKHSIDKETGEISDRYPPSFTFKIVQYDDEIKCKCHLDGEKKMMNVNNPEGEGYVNLGIVRPFDERETIKHEGIFKKGTKVKMILKCSSIYIISGRFGCTWQAEQIRIKPPQAFSDYSFLDSDEEGEGSEERDSKTENLGDSTAIESSDEDEAKTEVGSDDDDDEDDEDDGSELTRQVSRAPKKQ